MTSSYEPCIPLLPPTYILHPNTLLSQMRRLGVRRDHHDIPWGPRDAVGADKHLVPIEKRDKHAKSLYRKLL